MSLSGAKERQMPVISRDQFRVSVVLYPEDGFSIAQGVEFDITARGRDPIEASERFNDKFGAALVISIEVGDGEPLSGVGPAPQEFWKIYKSAKMRVLMDEMPLRLTGGPASYIHPEIRIAERRAA
jgi:hypothetical protein